MHTLKKSTKSNRLVFQLERYTAKSIQTTSDRRIARTLAM